MSQAEKDLKMMRWAVAGAPIFARCSKRQYMTIITDPSGRVTGTGYNGSPPGFPNCTDGACPRVQAGSEGGSSYDNCIACHSEQNALLYSDRTAHAGGTLYVNGPPCFTCAKLIASSGLKRLVHIKDPSYKQWPEIKSFLMKCGVRVVGLSPLKFVEAA